MEFGFYQTSDTGRVITVTARYSRLYAMNMQQLTLLTRVVVDDRAGAVLLSHDDAYTSYQSTPRPHLTATATGRCPTQDRP